MKPNQTLPAGYWPLEKSQPIIDKTQTIKLSPDLSQLTDGERKAVAKLLGVGKIFQSIYEDQRHKQALTAYRNLQALDRSFISQAPIILNLLTLIDSSRDQSRPRWKTRATRFSRSNPWCRARICIRGA